MYIVKYCLTYMCIFKFIGFNYRNKQIIIKRGQNYVKMSCVLQITNQWVVAISPSDFEETINS